MITGERIGGFTLFELMVTLAVAALILSLGVPGFRSFIQNNRAATHTNDVVTALNLGRSEATRRGAPVLLCSSSDGATCSGSNDWSSGWIVRRSAGAVLRTWPERSGGDGVFGSSTAGRGVYGTSAGTVGAGTMGQHTGSGAGSGVRGITSSATGFGVYGQNTATTGNPMGVWGAGSGAAR